MVMRHYVPLRVFFSRLVYRISREKYIYMFVKLLASPFVFLVNRLNRDSKKLFIIYDLEVNSPSYNFIHFIYASQVYAKRHRIRHIALVICADNRHHSRQWKALHDTYSASSLSRRSSNLLMQISDLFPIIKERHLISNRNALPTLVGKNYALPSSSVQLSPFDWQGYLWKALRSNEKMPLPFIARTDCLQFQQNLNNINKKSLPIVVITIRQSVFDTVRNSDIPSNLSFANYLVSKGYFPVIIPDSDSLDQSWIYDNLNFTCLGIVAAKDVVFRYWLYREAFLNIFVPNGPMGLCYYNADVRYLIMKFVLPGSCVTPDNLKSIEFSSNLNASRSGFFWASHTQLLSTLPDNYDALVKEFCRFCSVNRLH